MGSPPVFFTDRKTIALFDGHFHTGANKKPSWPVRNQGPVSTFLISPQRAKSQTPLIQSSRPGSRAKGFVCVGRHVSVSVISKSDKDRTAVELSNKKEILISSWYTAKAAERDLISNRCIKQSYDMTINGTFTHFPLLDLSHTKMSALSLSVPQYCVNFLFIRSATVNSPNPTSLSFVPIG